MKRIVRLTESDLTRIVKGVLNEKVTIDIYNLKNQTINLYKDKENKNFYMTVTIDQLEDSDGKSYVWYETRYPEGDLKVYCAKDGLDFRRDGIGGTLYNKTFEDTVKKQICTTNTKGVTVPKADFALTQPQTQQMGGGTLAERDLTRIVKRVLNESNDSPPKKNDPTEKVTYPGIKTKGGGYFIKPWTHDIYFKEVGGKKLYWLQFEGETGEWLNYESWVKKLTDSYIRAVNKAYGKS